MRRSLIVAALLSVSASALAILMTAPDTVPYRQAPGGWVIDADGNGVDSVTGQNTMPVEPDPVPDPEPDPEPEPDPDTDQMGVILTWSHATTRIGGTELLLSQIARYEIDYAGGVIAVGVVTRHEMDMAIPPPWTFRIRTVDTDGQTGPWSQAVTVQTQ